MTYFLEKNFYVDYDGKLHPQLYGSALIRPCKLDYNDVLKAIASPSIVCLEGQVASWSKSEFNTIEEWLIHLDLCKAISPAFEETFIAAIDTFDYYVAKIVDLTTSKVLFDNTDRVVKLLASRLNEVKA